MTQLGIGAVCCGDPTDCTIECDQKDLLTEVGDDSKSTPKKTTQKTAQTAAEPKEEDDE